MKKMILMALMCSLLVPGWSRAEEKTYKFAVDTYYPPFSYLDEKTGLTAGFDVDMAKAVCGKLKLKCEIVALPFNEIIPQVESGRIDVGCAGFAYTEERAKRVLYTNKYFRSSSLFLEIPDMIGTFSRDNLKGKKVAVQSTTNQEDYLRSVYGDIIEVVPVSGFDDIIAKIKNCSVDLGFIDGLSGYHYLKSDSGLELDIIGEPVHLDVGSCMVLKKGREDLRDKINEAIDALRISGEYDDINAKYFEFSVY